MPFTFSHPAIILPLMYLPKKWFSLTGLVIGSMTPDFEYFLRMKVQSNYSHTINGIFWFDLPLGILLAFIFHNIVRNRLFDNLPNLLLVRFNSFKRFDWNQYFLKNWLVVFVSIIIGASSHIFWDGFTHESGFLVQTIPALKNTIRVSGHQLPIFKFLQHASTIVGGLAIIFAILKFPRSKNVFSKINLKYWGIIVLLTLTIVFIRLITGLQFRLYGDVIVTGISAGIISLILTPLLMKRIISRC